ncbi:low specificity L-threonine aldolase [Paludicola sp. MB14-C6]|uniref:threonine aldolase family protein n=1 Tax=Paludihabitans sp. MB14-C6 TaxID=3070656 RepID=UPI0027DC601B|nr:low specificity L-threonine aldolase [Paludicola sp. MB14-C6]WMJ23969.1 low specificity L-threonine aldolase [Paludicola sp. MB14-C6]
MIRFECDYAEGAHERIIKRLVETNLEQTPGYGKDEYCEKARKVILDLCKNESAEVHFLVGGTQTNATVISATLRPHQGVISADTGHINGHESGAIEATGHKVLAIDNVDGKISAEQVERVYQQHWNDSAHEHLVQPGMVYISHPTETGMLYSKQELEALSKVCRKYSLPLFLDGARLGYALASEKSDVTLSDLANLCDVFYIGGTKVGALFGEAVVITHPMIKKDFRYFIKQKGGMLAKGRLLGIQFETLFEDGLYLSIAKHAVDLALEIKKAFQEKGCTFLYDSNTNQQFPILNNNIIVKLSAKYSFQEWEKIDNHYTAVRFCTSWATKEEDVKMLTQDIINL